MNNLTKLAIVGIARLDSGTENLLPVKNETNTWIQTVPEEFNTIADKTIRALPDNITPHVNTVIICSAADDNNARLRSFYAERARPRDILCALGVSLTTILNEKFPNITNIFKIEAACASGLYAIDVAKNYKNINDGVTVIAGVEKSTSRNFLNLFRQIGAVAENTDEPYPPFDQRRSGFVMGEGAAMLAITTQEYAEKENLEIIAFIDAIDTKTILTHPTSPSDPVQLGDFIHNTITHSGKSLTNISWWDAHATATPDGDQVEYNIFSKIFKDHSAVISSHKGRAGHCMSASAIIEIVNAIQSMQKGYATGTYKLKKEHVMVNDDRIITKDTKVNTKTFIKTSFGFGGRNGVAIITVLQGQNK